ncbi:MAG: endonuclease MutS2 [Lachnospiraceae bacterium]|nr:endonuclease MutS2 [Lachnospiraceae bacterium]
MNAKVLHTLEFDKITAILAGFAGSAPAKHLCETLRPSQDPVWIDHAQEETAAALARLLKSDRLSFGANFDVRRLMKDAGIGRMLSMSELLSIAGLLACTAAVSEYGVETGAPAEEPQDCLADYFLRLDPLPQLFNEISRCILSEEEMADNASADLSEIRRSFSTVTGRIHNQLNHMVNQSLRTYLQDAVITMRGDRYCIPVKAEYKSQVPGIVHDQSSTGSTYFIEPAAIVELNNKLTALQQQEQEEIRRILSALTAKVAQYADIISEAQKTLTFLDLIFAKAKYALKINATRPVYNTDHRIRLRKARHPLLDPAKAVPIDVALGGVYDLLIVTGPNTGGKTVSLKTVGLLTLMGQAGLHIPALDRSELSLFSEVFADIGDEQSIEQSLSTFSSHMTSIVQIMKKANADSLCLFDELGAGTDPTEGAALATAILNDLHSRGIRTMATTHYSELKIYALSTEGVENASCEFDVESLSPTYRLLTGIPGKSNAFAISKKLGLSEEIIEAAGQYISSESESFENVIADLENKRVALEKEQEAFLKQKEDLEARLKDVESREDRLQNQREQILKDAREEAKDILQDAKDVADETIRVFHQQGSQMKIQTMEKKRQNVREWLSRQDEAIYREAMKNSRSKKQEKAAPPKTLTPQEAIPGTPVHILSLQIDGTITSTPDRNGNVQVQCGIMRSKVKCSDLVHAQPSEETAAGKKAPLKTGKLDISKAAHVSAEINVLGSTVDEAIVRIDKYLDDAYMSHLERVRIVHGKGTGALRKGIHDYLRGNPVVKHFELAAHGEGDAGVTVVTFK